jgi:hypothetical protein
MQRHQGVGGGARYLYLHGWHLMRFSLNDYQSRRLPGMGDWPED